MRLQILYCSNCNLYTLSSNCKKCNNSTITRKPAKFSPQDKYSRYRQVYKKQILNKMQNEMDNKQNR